MVESPGLENRYSLLSRVRIPLSPFLLVEYIFFFIGLVLNGCFHYHKEREVARLSRLAKPEKWIKLNRNELKKKNIYIFFFMT